MIYLVISNVLAIALVGFLGYMLRDAIRSAREREDQLLTWVKDTPTAVVRADKPPKLQSVEPSYMDEEMEAEYESEAAPASDDAG
jgi:hypothetical protein